MSQLNHTEAIEAHVHWKLKLRKFLEGLPCDFDPKAVADDGACALGRWLKANPGHKELEAAHRDFHRRAGEVVTVAKAQGNAAAKVLLNGPEFAQATSSVVGLITQLRTGAGPVKAKASAPGDLDWNGVVVAYIQWRMRLRDWVNTGQGDFEPQKVGRSDGCVLGGWIKTHPSTSAPMKELVSAHDAFHQTAAQVVELQKKGKAEALSFLESPSFTAASARVVNAITTLRDAA
jgi:hypothetical protein